MWWPYVGIELKKTNWSHTQNSHPKCRTPEISRSGAGVSDNKRYPRTQKKKRRLKPGSTNLEADALPLGQLMCTNLTGVV